MSNSSKKIAIAILIILLTIKSIAQKDAKWTEPQPHPCFYGLKISVVNMGYMAGNYHWGVSIMNNYRTSVTFRYKLIVGGKAYSYYSVAFNLKPGAKKTEGTSFFNSISFDNPGTDWSVAITEVCFDGNTCGGKEECYADCDRIQGNENQPCDNNTPKKEPALMNGKASSPDDQKTNKGYTGALTEWQQEGKNIKLTIGQDENGIYWKKNANEPPVLFKNIRQGTYRYEVGTDFFIIRFESDNRISFWNNGSLLGYFTKPEEKKKETANKEPEKPTKTFTAVTNNCMLTGKWTISGSSIHHAGRALAAITCDGDNFTIKFEAIDGYSSIQFPAGTIINGKKVGDYYDKFSNKSMPAWELKNDLICGYRMLVLSESWNFHFINAANEGCAGVSFHKVN